MFKIYNVDRVNTLPGGVGQPHDRAIVVDLDRTERNIITGELQPITVLRGSLHEAHAFIAKQTCGYCGSHRPIGQSCECFDNNCQ